MESLNCTRRHDIKSSELFHSQVRTEFVLNMLRRQQRLDANLAIVKLAHLNRF